MSASATAIARVARVAMGQLTSQLRTMTFLNEAPRGWIALYTMVTFRPDISYGAVRRKADRQNKVVEGFAGGLAMASLGTAAWLLVRKWRLGPGLS